MTVAAVDTDRPGPAQRREQVRRLVLEEGFVRIDELGRRFGISLMTVHRDLDLLEGDGWLTKIRGGATANPNALLESGVSERSRTMAAEKARIAAAAAELLIPGQTVFIDDSTTALALVPHLGAKAPLTVATNSTRAVEQLATTKGVELIVLGGRYYPLQEACFGLATAEAIQQLHADVLMMSTTAVKDGACLHRSEVTVLVKRAFMACAARTVLLVDHAKFGRPAAHLLCRVDDFDIVVVDDGIDAEDLEELEGRDVVVEVASA